MNAMDYLKIAPFINDCPNCGNGLVGGGEGTLNVDDNIVTRTCKCGFGLEYDVNEGATKAKVQKAIDKTLKGM